MKTIGFIGLGTMGNPMAVNLLKKGFEVVAYNRTPSKADNLLELGARTVSTPAQAAKDADVVITMLSTDDVVLEHILGAEGIITALRPGQTVIDCSTVSPETSRRIHGELAAHAVDFLDAPVTGSKPGAENGTLVFMIGGEEEALETHRDVFEALGTRIVYMGPSGSGSHAKLAHNTMVGINALGLMEGLSLVTKAGLDPERFLSIVLAGSANSKQAELKGQKVVNRDFSNQFSLGLMLKDLLLAGDVANGFQLPSPMLRAATGIFQMGRAKGLSEEDLSSVIQCYEDWMGLQVGVRTETPAAKPAAEERRRSTRVQLHIKLHLSVYQWQQEGSFSGQLIDGTLVDLSESGLLITSASPLAQDMFVVIHFPQEADLPPLTGRIIRIHAEGDHYKYGCMLSGLPPYVRLKLEAYVRSKSEASAPAKG
ncbi:NAD(P)-binding domain-containing protein [Paenibacillus mucilaginosus]|uniref:Tartronate semialdehyde reductase n=2 Tax=Paenibacillus mucilaginosus TaxID=61624 RepID=H6NT07_9BACL|nr:NAD(P)-binding domain-containing protein [Paenibacillus mucilaginosus]AEI39264.1 tartronate semialdehyde reductase [Paenibacillus mucilaginosus KNP414]AFC27548.1 tartronate semialdehyde reductase [Paenibacillus mucilaginosus 3016]MCG7217096.1 NAD(P)-binding domain-containing protein [Paenibacillus mucilaginosus]WDM28269.1 NAD-binding protein [Paenibacillus mucilaginosus]WFA16445.1 tartronate semialdehyde reductase [Paenibacillus mucilaginosus]